LSGPALARRRHRLRGGQRRHHDPADREGRHGGGDHHLLRAGVGVRGRRAGAPLMQRAFAIALACALSLLATTAEAAASRLGPAPPPAPRRVVTLAPSLTELVLELGAGARLVGVSRFDDAEAVRALPRVGGLVDPSAE